jgi:hypothetical protein
LFQHETFLLNFSKVSTISVLLKLFKTFTKLSHSDYETWHIKFAHFPHFFFECEPCYTALNTFQHLVLWLLWVSTCIPFKHGITILLTKKLIDNLWIVNMVNACLMYSITEKHQIKWKINNFLTALVCKDYYKRKI